ncbi:MAG: ribbon-helix-helix protein, CopG family [Anaerolineae bacterium]
MTDFTIPDDLAELLNDVARRENRPVDEIVEEALKQYAEEHLPPSASEQPQTRNLLLLIAQAADELGEGSKEGDIAERSREILNNDIPEYLMRRMRGDYSDVEK